MERVSIEHWSLRVENHDIPEDPVIIDYRHMPSRQAIFKEMCGRKMLMGRFAVPQRVLVHASEPNWLNLRLNHYQIATATQMSL